MTDKPRVWVSRPTFPGVIARLEPCFEVSVVFEGKSKVPAELFALDNAVLSPHIASATTDTRRAMTSVAVDNVLAMFGHGLHAGRPPDILNPNVL
ncbi:MAG: hydroxyacid dehydrogenase [Rhodanobacter sp.]|nr:MAG: hydroxyacid dehydrogenase [Rhodanobacter sp.]TAL99685.1 MAG: hydroxyacid dehydrogenase [Rhodanobacter sp.]TAM42572.1 MAG: hydroxyacid dehydrogenase [Rhodanobacter sp.]TAN26229.1 MAG: hydroxyacid dehydrogenase [Rhodanobacter sp.]